MGHNSLTVLHKTALHQARMYLLFEHDFGFWYEIYMYFKYNYDTILDSILYQRPYYSKPRLSHYCQAWVS